VRLGAHVRISTRNMRACVRTRASEHRRRGAVDVRARDLVETHATRPDDVVIIILVVALDAARGVLCAASVTRIVVVVVTVVVIARRHRLAAWLSCQSCVRGELWRTQPSHAPRRPRDVDRVRAARRRTRIRMHAIRMRARERAVRPSSSSISTSTREPCAAFIGGASSSINQSCRTTTGSC
jgi:hypothetical protein